MIQFVNYVTLSQLMINLLAELVTIINKLSILLDQVLVGFDVRPLETIFIHLFAFFRDTFKSKNILTPTKDSRSWVVSLYLTVDLILSLN